MTCGVLTKSPPVWTAGFAVAVVVGNNPPVLGAGVGWGKRLLVLGAAIGWVLLKSPPVVAEVLPNKPPPVVVCLFVVLPNKPPLVVPAFPNNPLVVVVAVVVFIFAVFPNNPPVVPVVVVLVVPKSPPVCG